MSKKLKIIEVSTPTCGICKMIAPVVQKVVESQGDRIIFENKVVDWDDEIVQKYDIRRVPTFLFFDGDTLLDTYIGATTINHLNQLINKLVDQLNEEK